MGQTGHSGLYAAATEEQAQGYRQGRQRYLLSCVLDDWDPQQIKVPQIACLPLALRNSFDLLKPLDLKTGLRPEITLNKKSDQYRPLRVRMNTATGACGEGSEEQGSAGRCLVRGRFAKVLSRLKVHDEHIRWSHEFLLYS